MENTSIVRIHAYVTINESDWDKFLQMVAEVQIIVKEEGPENTLIHQTYHDSKGYNCLIIEAYKNEQAFLQHLENIRPVSEKYQVDWTVNRIELSGPYSRDTVNALETATHAMEFLHFDKLIS